MTNNYTPESMAARITATFKNIDNINELQCMADAIKDATDTARRTRYRELKNNAAAYGYQRGDQCRFFLSRAGCYIDGKVTDIKRTRIHVEVLAGQELKAGVYCVRADRVKKPDTDALFVL